LNGPAEVKAHPWIKNFPWKKLINKELESPFIPSVRVLLDVNINKRNE